MSNDQFDDSLYDRFAELDSELFELPANAGQLHGNLLKRTSRVQTTRRVVRRVGHAVTFAVLFGLGYITAQLRTAEGSARPALQTAETEEHRASPQGSTAENPANASVAQVEAPPWHADIQPVTDTEAEASPEQLEQRARRSAHGRSERLRRAGDLYLSERSDVGSALRCYRELLALLPENNRRTVNQEDSWLLVALKQSSTERS